MKVVELSPGRELFSPKQSSTTQQDEGFGPLRSKSFAQQKAYCRSAVILFLIKVDAPDENYSHTAQKLQATNSLFPCRQFIFTSSASASCDSASTKAWFHILNLHVILACLLRDFALFCHGIDFHFFFSLLFCELVCVFRERLKQL